MFNEMKAFSTIIFVALVTLFHPSTGQYTPDWPSLDSRPLPAWYDESKVGIFMHFGPYSVPGVESEWFWYQTVRNESEGDHNCVKYMEDYFPPKFTYQDFGPMLTMDFFNASEIADIVLGSGAKYLVFTSKHHDGFCNWPSTYTYGWNSLAIGANRNVLQELKSAFEDKDPSFHFGLYYSLFEWFNPIYLLDKSNGLSTRNYPLNKMLPEMKELVETFSPHVLWVDGDWEAPPEYHGSKDFLAWLYNESPSKDEVVTNDRWGIGTGMTHGGFYSGPDRYNPGTLQAHKWENAMTIDKESWGIRRNIPLSDVYSSKEIIRTMAETVSCGGNILINVGPTKEGTIIPIFQERLRDIGDWLQLNGEAIYSTVPWMFQNDTINNDVWYTQKGNVVYGIVTDWPQNDALRVSSPIVDPFVTKISMVGVSGDLTFDFLSNIVTIDFPLLSQVFREAGEISQLAYVLKFENLVNVRADDFPEIKINYA